MAEYLIFICENEAAYASGDQAVWQQAMEAHNRFAGQVGEVGGKLAGGNALQRRSPSRSW